MLPRAAVAIPCYNAEDWITRCIESALAQRATHPDTLVIVVDDGSSDGSVSAVEKFGDQVILSVGPNLGANHARNMGQKIAREQGASYITFLDSDDYLEGQIIAGAVAVAEAQGAQMVLSNMHIEYENGERLLRPRYADKIAPEEFFFGWMRDKDYVNPPGILWRVDFVDEIGGWDESLARAQDLEITLRALLSSPVIHKNEQGAAIHAQVNPNSISRSQSLKALDSRFRANAGLQEKIKDMPGFAEAAPLFHREIYQIARAAFIAGHVDLGRQALALIRDEGFHGHPGNRSHSIVSSVLGLERKVKLWGG